MSKKNIKIYDSFWIYYRELIRREMIPYQWKVLHDDINVNIERERNDASIPNEKSHAIENFRIAAGLKEGKHYGWVFQDSDVYKWLEAVAYSLHEKMDDKLKHLADEVIELIGSAQEENGYLSTYFTIEEPDRKLKRLDESHELYCAGHFMEAAVAYHEATGNEKVLQIACRLADYIDSCFGEGKLFGYDGHEEVEIGLMKLYHLTKEERYLELCRYFLSVRGTDQGRFFRQQRLADRGERELITGMERWPLSYFQAHKPLSEQDTAEGHAVRLVYMCTAMADAAAESGDKKLLCACEKIWRNIVDKRMYITGGIGSTVLGESFTYDYDLPNDTMYCETCASVGLIFFAYQMLRNEIRGEYGDVMERALYNTVLAGMALDGKHFFYVNPLEADPEASKKDPGKSHVKPVRPQWLGCACCPPNLARLLTSIEKYSYLQKENTVAAILFLDNEASFELQDGTLRVKQETHYPWEGTIRFILESDAQATFGIRIPGWADAYTVTLNQEIVIPDIRDGYMYITGKFENDEILLKLAMKVEKWYAHPFVKSDIGKAAVMRGPVVYCLEEADNGPNLSLVSIQPDAEFTYSFHEEELNGIGVIEAEGYKEYVPDQAMPLYTKRKPRVGKRVKKLKWIPYYVWANRGENEMQVWVREEGGK